MLPLCVDVTKWTCLFRCLAADTRPQGQNRFRTVVWVESCSLKVATNCLHWCKEKKYSSKTCWSPVRYLARCWFCSIYLSRILLFCTCAHVLSGTVSLYRHLVCSRACSTFCCHSICTRASASSTWQDLPGKVIPTWLTAVSVSSKFQRRKKCRSCYWCRLEKNPLQDRRKNEAFHIDPNKFCFSLNVIMI